MLVTSFMVIFAMPAVVLASGNTVHFTILMAAVKLIQAVGWGARGRSL
jgi:hypothetical protein